MKESFNKMIKLRSRAFADPKKTLLFNINTVDIIRTDDEPVYYKLYPYPMVVADFVNSKVKQLLENLLFCRPNPIWVVDKKMPMNTDTRKREW